MVMSFSKAIDPDHDISYHHYYDNYTVYSYHCSNHYCIAVAITIATIYVHKAMQYATRPGKLAS